MNRRTFIETSVAAAIASSTSTSLFAAPPAHEIKTVGIQLYTVRAEMKQDFEGTVAGIAKIGYKEVEFAGYFGKTPQETRSIIDKNGLTSPSAHHGMDDLEAKTQEIIDGAHVDRPEVHRLPVSRREEPDCGWVQEASGLLQQSRRGDAQGRDSVLLSQPFF